MVKHVLISLFTGSALFFASIAFSESNFDFFFKMESQYQDVVVDEVRSADTIRINKGKVGEKGELIKLIGLQAPKAPKLREYDYERDQYGFVKKPEVSPLTTIEERAFEFAKELLKDKHVRLEFDSEKNGGADKTFAYVFLLQDNTFVNAEILRYGYASLKIRPPNTKYAKELRAAYKEARTEMRGLQGE